MAEETITANKKPCGLNKIAFYFILFISVTSPKYENVLVDAQIILGSISFSLKNIKCLNQKSIFD